VPPECVKNLQEGLLDLLLLGNRHKLDIASRNCHPTNWRVTGGLNRRREICESADDLQPPRVANVSEGEPDEPASVLVL